MDQDEFYFDETDFNGITRLFPLPNLVLFPHVMQPLHIFEPRYRAMMEEALATDKLITMAVLAKGWEDDYEGRPKLESIACLGRVATHERLPDGRFNLLLVGLKRVRIQQELAPHSLFREAKVSLCDDQYPVATAPMRASLQKDLACSFKKSLPKQSMVHEQVDELLGGSVPLGVLTDIIAYTLDLEMSVKLRLLAECNVDRRAALLLEFMQPGTMKLNHGGLRFPPDFSAN
jgi:Lon protease-like protein